MKKFTFVFIVALLAAGLPAFCQPILYTEAPLFDNSTSTGRAPNGTSAHVYMRGCALVKATELTGVANNATLTSFGFTMNSGGATSAATGNFTLYLQNTSDATFNKSTTWGTAITGMTTVYASTMTIPISAVACSVVVTLSTPFVYTGGGVYVAYDWYNPGPYSSVAAIYRCNSAGLSPGCETNASTSSAPTLMGTTAFRPCFLFGVANSYTNEISVIGMEAPGRLTGMFGTSHTVTGIVKNNSNQTRNNVVVSLNAGGANTFANTQTITSMASGAVTTVTFATFTPLLSGLNTLSVSVPSDENNTNNLSTYTQSVTCNEWALNPAAVSYTMGAVGFNTGAGIIAVSYTNPATATLTGMRGAISTNTPSVGNQSWGVLLSSAGVIVATTNTLTITNAMLGTLATYTFATPPVLSANTSYYLGFAQPANVTGYFPAGTYTTNYVPYLNYVTTTTTGGTPAQLTSNLGFFAIEGIFTPTLPLTVSAATVSCGNTATLTATTAASYSWASGPTNANYNVTPTVSTVYTVNALSSVGCAATATTMVSVTPLTLTASSSASYICYGGSVNIGATGASSYTWSSGPSVNSASFTATPSVNTNYLLIANNAAGCLGIAAVSVSVSTLTAVNVSTPVVIACTGNSISVTASGASTYTWITASGTFSTPALSLVPTTSGIYTVNGSDGLGCTKSNTVGVLVSAFPAISTSSQAVVCGSQATLTASTTASYSWTSGPSNANFLVTPTVNTTYSVTATNSAGCSTTNTVAVAVNPITVTAVASASAICVGSSVTVTGSGAGTYTWSTGPSTNSASFTGTPTVTTIYGLQGANSAGCSGTASVTVVVNSFTSLGVSASSFTTCAGGTISASASGASTYTWNTGSATYTTAALSQTIGTGGTYTVTGADANGCLASSSIAVTVNALPTVTASAMRNIMCTSESNTLNAGGGASYVWNGTSSGATFVLTPSVSGVMAYTVVGTNASSCSANAVITVTVSDCLGLSGSTTLSNGIRIYPNPANGLVNLELDGSVENTSLKIVNALGQVVFEASQLEQNNRINLEQQANGVYYMLVIRNGQPVSTSRIIKQ